MNNPEYTKAKAFVVEKLIDYMPKSVVIKTIIKKATGNVSLVSFDAGEMVPEKTSPFDTFIQIIDGTTEIRIEGVSHHLDTGKSIIVPAHRRHSIHAKARFKMISTVIKSGYEDLTI